MGVMWMNAAWVAATLLGADPVAWAAPGVPAGWLRGLKPRAAPQRVVSLAPSVTESLFALGLGPRVVGVTRYCDRPVEALALPKVGGFSDPSLEAVVALKPDAVVAVPSEANRRVVERMVDLGVPVLVVPDTTVADVGVALHTMGDALGAAARADAVWGAVQQRVAVLQARVKGLPRPRVLVAYDHRPWVVAGPGSFAWEMVGLAGGQALPQQAKVPYPQLGLEALVRMKPQVILDASMQAAPGNTSAVAAVLAPHPSIPAVANHRIHRLPAGVLVRPGPGLAQDLELLVALLHPATATSQPRGR